LLYKSECRISYKRIINRAEKCPKIKRHSHKKEIDTRNITAIAQYIVDGSLVIDAGDLLRINILRGTAYEMPDKDVGIEDGLYSIKLKVLQFSEELFLRFFYRALGHITTLYAAKKRSLPPRLLHYMQQITLDVFDFSFQITKPFQPEFDS